MSVQPIQPVTIAHAAAADGGTQPRASANGNAGVITADTVSLSLLGRNLDALFSDPAWDPNDPGAVVDEFFNLNGRTAGRLFGLEQRADPAILRQTLARIGEMLQAGVVGYEVRELRNGQRYQSFLSVELAPGGPYGRALPPGDPRARLDR